MGEHGSSFPSSTLFCPFRSEVGYGPVGVLVLNAFAPTYTSLPRPWPGVVIVVFHCRRAALVFHARGPVGEFWFHMLAFQLPYTPTAG